MRTDACQVRRATLTEREELARLCKEVRELRSEREIQ